MSLTLPCTDCYRSNTYLMVGSKGIIAEIEEEMSFINMHKLTLIYVRCWMCETKMGPVPMNHVMTSFRHRRDYELIYTLMLSRISAFMYVKLDDIIIAPTT
jgi:hypothetical protein